MSFNDHNRRVLTEAGLPEELVASCVRSAEWMNVRITPETAGVIINRGMDYREVEEYLANRPGVARIENGPGNDGELSDAKGDCPESARDSLEEG